MESEFFGHRKGAFTGAVNDKAGLVQAAAGGTLFLDEIADLPLAMQVKLLRVIPGASGPAGGRGARRKSRRSHSLRHASGSERALVKDGEFREDLYYRINVIELAVPALRDRGNDILLLANHLLKRHERGPEALTIRRSAGAVELPIPGQRS